MQFDEKRKQNEMASYNSPSKNTSYSSRTAMSQSAFDATYLRFRPGTDEEHRKLMCIGAIKQQGLGRCVITKLIWDAHLAAQQNKPDTGDESSDVEMEGFYPEVWNAGDLLVAGKDIHLWAPLAKGNKDSMPAARKRAKIRQFAHGGFCGITKSWKIPFGIDPALFAEGKAYA